MGEGPDIDVEAARASLLERRAELERLLAEGRGATQPVELDQTTVGRLSRMDALQVQAMALETARRREAELERIRAALGRIETGDYGWCLRCGEAIATRRLELDPTVPLCIACAGAH